MADVRMKALTRFVHQGATHEEEPPPVGIVTSVTASTIETDDYFTVAEPQDQELATAGLAVAEPLAPEG